MADISASMASESKLAAAAAFFEMPIETIASAAGSITIPDNLSAFYISGSATVTGFTASVRPGRVISFVCANGATPTFDNTAITVGTDQPGKILAASDRSMSNKGERVWYQQWYDGSWREIAYAANA